MSYRELKVIEIQRRLSKHVDIKKRGDSIDAGQKRVSQYEYNFGAVLVG